MQQQNKLIEAVAARLKDYPLYSQEDSAGNPMIAARLFNAAGSGTWYLMLRTPLPSYFLPNCHRTILARLSRDYPIPVIRFCMSSFT
ncbi:hypothetical protein UNDKW_4033 [Undibacterium sp. KW1]|uniref:hypothetical protein n=1 Tax=Undibacterium sp. KW1 TaxID=2058624 RepID=UPI001331E54D|nr:hypothetical protein [Undibacterium sp. KW1]BBB62306.1 hypothetical protein UNDKW_4033 [Undibacterium sp. KW1]